MIKRLVIQTVLWLAFTAALLFVAAGTWRWPAAWVFLVLVLVIGLGIGLWLARHDPALLAERLGSLVQRRQEPWDRVFTGTLIVLWHAWLVLIALDAARYRWSHVPVSLQGLGAVLVAISYYVFWLTFRENSYAAPVVKIQRERAHHVVTSGLYRHVRHPMYGGALLFFVGVPLLLGSWAGLAVVPVLVALLALRAVREERTLARELDGYADYAARVRYRLVPGIW
jgi:protein-S-isoprenylcysteine O-methyltransferase Ste14